LTSSPSVAVDVVDSKVQLAIGQVEPEVDARIVFDFR
jgi:hypothetical protein